MKRLVILVLLLGSVGLAEVTTQNHSVTFTCTGSVGPFGFTFPISDSAAMTVIQDGTTLGTGAYTITPVNNNYTNGGNVTLNTSCPAASTLVLKRMTPLTQGSVFTDNMPIPMKTFERGLDKLTEITQELDGGLGLLATWSCPAGQTLAGMDNFLPQCVVGSGGGGGAGVGACPVGQFEIADTVTGPTCSVLPPGGHIIQNAGADLPQEPRLNFTIPAGCADNPGVSTDCTIQGVQSPFGQVNSGGLDYFGAGGTVLGPGAGPGIQSDYVAFTTGNIQSTGFTALGEYGGGPIFSMGQDNAGHSIDEFLSFIPGQGFFMHDSLGDGVQILTNRGTVPRVSVSDLSSHTTTLLPGYVELHPAIAAPVPGNNTYDLYIDSGTFKLSCVQVGGGSCMPTATTGTVTASGPPNQHQIAVFNTETDITGLDPTAIAGIPLISQGVSANPLFGVAVLAGGGTNQPSWTPSTCVHVNAAGTALESTGADCPLTAGSVTDFSAGDLSPIFTTSVATSTTTPALSFALTNAAANTVLANATGGSAAPGYTSDPHLSSVVLEGSGSGAATVEATATGGGLYLGSHNATVDSSGNLVVVGCTGCGVGTGTVTTVTSGDFAPLFTVGIATPTSTPAFTFTASNFSAHKFFGNATGGSTTPSASSIGTADLPFTYSGNTAELGTVTGALTPGDCLASDASGNIIDGGPCPGGGGGSVSSVGLLLPAGEFAISGSPVTGVGTLTAAYVSQAQNLVFASPNGSSGTPTFRAMVAADVPTLNQTTTGSAAKWTTPRLLGGNSVDGSANVPLANKFIAQGTGDAGLSNAQFLGALPTGIVKNTTTTGVLSIAVAGDFPTLNQSTTGSAATLTTPRAINGVNFNGSAPITVPVNNANDVTNTDQFVLFTGTQSGNFAPKTVAALKIHPSTGILTATGFAGGLTGNASTATALAANGTNCSANRIPLGVDASGNAEGCYQPTVSTLSDASTVVLNNASNTWSTGAQSFASATSLTVPVAAAPTPTVNGQIAYATGTNLFKVGVNGFTKTIATTDAGVATAVALATAPTPCALHQYPNGVDVGGNSINCEAAAFTNLSGTIALSQVPASMKIVPIVATLGNGFNPITANPYPSLVAWNETGVTWTILAISCYADSGASTLNVTNGAGTPLITSAITCGPNGIAGVAGTLSATQTLAPGDGVKVTITADGTSKQVTLRFKATR